MPQRPKSTPHLFFVHSQRRLLAYKLCKVWNSKYSSFVTDLCLFFSNVFFLHLWLEKNGLTINLKIKGCRLLVVSFVCRDIFGDPVLVVWLKPPRPPLCSTFFLTSLHVSLSLSADCWPQSYKTLSILADAAAPPGGRAEGVWPGTARLGPVLNRARAIPGPGQSSPPSPPPPLPST